MSRRSWFHRQNAYRSAANKPRRPQLRVEKLEDRQMQAGDVPTAIVQQGTLYIYGTNEADHIEVRFENGQINIPGVQITNAAGQIVSSLARTEVPHQIIATGQGGDDYIAAVEVSDRALPMILHGNAGDDTLVGGSSDDVLVGQDGFDTLTGGAGNDKLIAALYADERDPLQTEDRAEWMYGGDGDDVLLGSRGVDILDGGAGNDQLTAFDGDDSLYGGPGADWYDGGDGVDTLSAVDLFGATLTNDEFTSLQLNEFGDFVPVAMSVTGIEKAWLTAALDSSGVSISAAGFNGSVYIAGSQGNDVLRGAAGDDIITGLGGDDQLSGGGGFNDMLDGGRGTDTLLGYVGGSHVRLTDAVFEEIGMSAAHLSDFESATFINSSTSLRASVVPTRPLEILPNRPVFSPIGRRGALGIGSPTRRASKPTTYVDASEFAGMISVVDPQGVDLTGEMVAMGELKANRVTLNFLPEEVSPADKLLGQLKRETRQFIESEKGYGRDPGMRLESGFRHGTAFIRFERAAFYRWGDKREQGVMLAGPVLEKYTKYFAEKGALGMPTGRPQEFTVFGGMRGIAAITFENGVIAMSNDRPDDWQAVWGNCYRQFLANGGFDQLGAPLGHSYRFENGEAANFERGTVVCLDDDPRAFRPAVLNFESNMTVYNVDGSYSAVGLVNFRDHWQTMGGVNGPLHAPVGRVEPITMSNGETGYMQRFQDGALFWAPGREVTSVQGLIYKMYMHEGGPGGRFGLPLGDEYVTEDGVFTSTFQFGYIQFSPHEYGFRDREFRLKLHRTNQFWIVDEDDFAG